MSLSVIKYCSNQNIELSMSHFLIIQVLKVEVLLEVKVEAMVDIAIVEAMVEAILSKIATIPTMANNLEKG